MIQPNELRIGNLIFGISDRVEIVCGVLEKTVKTRLLKVSKILSSKYKDVTGIPITEDWLVKFNFEDVDVFQGHIFTGDEHKNIYYVLDGGYLDFHGDKIFLKYIHELQNCIYEFTKYELKLQQ